MFYGKSIALIVSAFLIAALVSCALPGWNSNLKDFIETGLSVVYLNSSSYSGASGGPGVDVRRGEEVTVFVTLNNPKSLDLEYTLEADGALVASGAAAPGAGTEFYFGAFNGAMSDMKIFSEARNETEIRADASLTL